MFHLKNIATAFCGLTLGLLALSGCEGADTYDLETPDWLSQKIDSINAAKNSGNEETWTDLNEDVYTIGNTDFSTGWWQSFSKYYQIPDGKVWHAVFNLNINPDEELYYKNFALVVTNDVDRGATGYKEYGAFRYDFTNDSTFNSQWGDYLWFKYASCNNPMSPDASQKDAANLQKLGGQVMLSVDRTNPDTFKIKITNGTVTKTLVEPISLPNFNSDPSDNNIRCFIVPEGSFINFLSSNIKPIGGYTSAADKQPLSMVLHNVPDEVQLNDTLDKAMAGVSATVTFEEGVTKEIPAAQLYFVSAPDMTTEGVKNLVVVYDKTFKGEAAARPVSATATFMVSDMPVELSVKSAPTNRRYYFYQSAATAGIANRTMAFNPAGLVVEGRFPDGSVRTIDNSKLTFADVPAEPGIHDVTITRGQVSTKTRVRVAESPVTFVMPSPAVLGAEDNSSLFFSAHFDNDVQVPAGETREFSFTNYCGVKNWNNWLVVLRNAAKAEYAVLRADNWGWGNGYGTARNSGGQANWDTWLAAMNGAKVNVFVTNCGNGTADVQAVMHGTDGNTYIQYYLGISTVDPSDLFVDFTVDNDHLVFSNSPLFAKRHYASSHSYRARH